MRIATKAVPKSVYLLIVFFFISCREEGEVKKKSITFAYCLLNPRYTNQTVIVDSLYGLTEEIRDTAGISGATVFIVEEPTAETVYFAETKKKGVYQDTLRRKWVKPLATYKLFVSFRGDTLTGKTTVPDTFRIISPKNFDTVQLSAFDTLIWHKSQQAKAYFIMAFHPDTAKFAVPIVTRDTFLDISRWRDFYFDMTASYVIKVFAWDEQRYRYMVVKNQQPDTLGDGLGHFGSQTQDTISLYVIRPNAKRGAGPFPWPGAKERL